MSAREERSAATTPPFVTTTTYGVWTCLPGGEWTPWRVGMTEQHHAVDESNAIVDGIARQLLAPREIRIARETKIIEWVDE